MPLTVTQEKFTGLLNNILGVLERATVPIAQFVYSIHHELRFHKFPDMLCCVGVLWPSQQRGHVEPVS